MGRESYAPVVYIGCTLAVSAGDCLNCSNQGEKTHSTVVALFPELWVLENITKEKASWALNMCAFTFFSESKCDQLRCYCALVFLKIMDCNLINPFTPKLLLLISPSIWKGSLGNIIKHLSFLIDYRIWNTIAQEGGFDCFGPWLTCCCGALVRSRSWQKHEAQQNYSPLVRKEERGERFGTPLIFHSPEELLLDRTS